jgi:hypothetical protein
MSRELIRSPMAQALAWRPLELDRRVCGIYDIVSEDQTRARKFINSKFKTPAQLVLSIAHVVW